MNRPGSSDDSIQNELKRRQQAYLQNEKKRVDYELKYMAADLKASLPEPGSMVQKAIDMCLDRIRNGEEVAHYKEVLTKLSKIKLN